MGSSALVFYCLTAVSLQQNRPENNAPKITITAPTNNSQFYWNSMVPYSIRIADVEDGNSEYNEIASNEVLMMIRYLRDSNLVKKYMFDRSKTNPEPLVWMRNSTCFSCHSAQAKLIGPSYNLVAKKYPNNSTSVETLAKKIIEGNSGTWGDTQMPPHPDLTIEKTRQIVKWILKNGADPDQNYFVGVEGAFYTKGKPENEAKKGVYVLTASYIDHGLKDVPGSSKQGQHSIVLKNF